MRATGEYPERAGEPVCQVRFLVSLNDLDDVDIWNLSFKFLD